MRASDRIKEYILAHVQHPEKRAGARLPTITEVTAALKVGRSTVQSVFQELTKEGLIRSHPGRGTFLVAKRSRKERGLRIAVSVPLSRSGIGGDWAYRIGGGIIHAAFHVKPPATLIPLPEEIEGKDAVIRRMESQMDEVDALILFPYSLWPIPVRDKVCASYEKAGKPVVYFHPPTESATANFVSFNYFEWSRWLGEALRESGRSHFLMLMAGLLSENVPFRMRHTGFVTGLGPGLGSALRLHVVETPQSDERRHARQAVLELLKHSKLDGIYAAGEAMAVGALDALRELKLRVPQDVSVIAGAGPIHEPAFGQRVTHAAQPIEQLGEELVKMVCERAALDGASLPGLLLPCGFTPGETTRPEENERLIAKLSK